MQITHNIIVVHKKIYTRKTFTDSTIGYIGIIF